MLCRIRRRRTCKRTANGERDKCGELPLFFHSFEHCFLPFITRWKEPILAVHGTAFIGYEVFLSIYYITLVYRRQSEV